MDRTGVRETRPEVGARPIRVWPGPRKQQQDRAESPASEGLRGWGCTRHWGSAPLPCPPLPS